jgi:hypothetical protein
MNEVGECSPSKLIIEQTAEGWRREGQALIDDAKAFLVGNEDEPVNGE